MISFGGQQVCLLSFGGLRPSRYARVADQFRHGAPRCLITDDEYRDSMTGLRHTVMRISAPPKLSTLHTAVDGTVRRLESEGI